MVSKVNETLFNNLCPKADNLDFFVMNCRDQAVIVKEEIINIVKSQIQNEFIIFCAILLIANIILFYNEENLFNKIILIFSEVLIVAFFVYIRFII